MIVPFRLLKLHPRKAGHPSDAGALAPAIVQGVVSAFEGFTEDFFATAFYLQGQSFAQIVKKMAMNNPSLRDVEKLMQQEFAVPSKKLREGFAVAVWEPPAVGSRARWKRAKLTWDEAVQASEGWLQVRHCLSHGLTSGWSTEIWPGPVTKPGNKDAAAAKDVLRPMRRGRHSLVMHGAITCARIFRAGAEHATTLVAEQFDETLSWNGVPELQLSAVEE